MKRFLLFSAALVGAAATLAVAPAHGAAILIGQEPGGTESADQPSRKRSQDDERADPAKKAENERAKRAKPERDVVFEGVEDALRGKLEIISELTKDDRRYPTMAALRRAAERDRVAFDKAMIAAGYYASEVAYRIERPSPEQTRIVFKINAGSKFTIADYEILYRDEAEGRPQTLDEAGVKPDFSAAGASLRDVQATFLTHLWNVGYPAAKIVTRRAIAQPERASANAVLVFESGPRARFGEIRIEGADRTRDRFIRRLRTFESGELYEKQKIIEYRDDLSETGLFASVSVEPGEVAPDGDAPILIDVTERKRRTIGAGASFSTEEGPGGRLFFEYRNLFGRGEIARVDVNASRFQQAIDFSARKPLPRIPGFAFGGFGFANETTDAFNARTVRANGGLAKLWLNDRLETRAGLGLESSKIEENGDEERTYFISLPLAANWNSEDDLLAPTKGFRAGFSVTPYTGSDTFTQLDLNARSRIFFGAEDRFTLAGRARLAGTLGSSLTDLPLNKRFYAGGGGSIRGFGFQEAGPLDDDGDPLGGRSLAIAAAEFRGKVTQNIELATFFDAGVVSPSALPRFDEREFIGVGAGARYFSPVGPIRLDVAFPMNKRESDASFQIYIAIGQPF